MLRESITIPPHGHVSFNPTTDLNRKGGNIIITSNVKLNGLVLIGGSTNPMYDIDIKDKLYNRFIISQVDADNVNWKSIVMLQNPTTKHITVNVAVYNNNGYNIFNITVTLTPNGSNQVNIGNFVTVKSGYIILTSSDSFTAFMLYDGTMMGFPWRGGLSAVPY